MSNKIRKIIFLRSPEIVHHRSTIFIRKLFILSHFSSFVQIDSRRRPAALSLCVSIRSRKEETSAANNWKKIHETHTECFSVKLWRIPVKRSNRFRREVPGRYQLSAVHQAIHQKIHQKIQQERLPDLQQHFSCKFSSGKFALADRPMCDSPFSGQIPVHLLQTLVKLLY